MIEKESVLLCVRVCENDFFRGGAEIRRAADFGLRKLDECPTYPCGLIREHFANVARAFWGRRLRRKECTRLEREMYQLLSRGNRNFG